LFCLLIEGVSFATGLLLKPAGVCVWERTQAWSREYTGPNACLQPQETQAAKLIVRHPPFSPSLPLVTYHSLCLKQGTLVILHFYLPLSISPSVKLREVKVKISGVNGELPGRWPAAG
jgi:hypothetical protein